MSADKATEAESVSTNQAAIPAIDEFANLKAIAQQIKTIIEKIDFVELNEKVILLELCSDALHFLESKKPKLFVMYVSHALREVAEKFFGEAKSVGNNDFFDFNEATPNELLIGLDESTYGFIETRDSHKIKLKRLIKIEERNSLLRMSTDETWHQDIWELNDTYAENDSSKRDLGTKQFYEIIPAKYSVSSWTYGELTKTRKALYRRLSGYAHGGKVKEIVEVLEKGLDERSEKDNKIIERYLEDNISIIDIFRPFEATTNEKIKQIDELLNE